MADGDVEILLGSVKMVADNFAREFANHGHLKLEKYISPNFVALFVGKNEEILLRSFVQELTESLSSSLGLSPSQVWLKFLTDFCWIGSIVCVYYINSPTC